MARRCKCGCLSELPPAAKCADIVSKKGYGSIECLTKHTRAKEAIKAEKAIKARNIEFKKKVMANKKAITPRSRWLSRLQTLINQWVVNVRDKDEPCCTCGTTKPTIKYDAGHMISRGASPELRFELTNIHKQCSMKCNVYGSGKRKEYELFILDKYGQAHLDWLNGSHKLLKEQYPDNESIEKDMVFYRKLLRDAGLRPNE